MASFGLTSKKRNTQNTSMPTGYKSSRVSNVTRPSQNQKITAQDWVSVSRDEVKRVMEMLDNTPYLFHCLSRLVSSLTGKGVTMKLWEFGREVDLGEIHSQIIKGDWGGIFYPQFVRYLWGLGFVVCKIVPHPKKPGIKIPFVVPYTKYELRFSESSSSSRVYWVHYLDDNDGYETDENGVQLNENNAGYPLPDGSVSHLIFSFPEWEPNESGVIRSPIRYAGEEYLFIQRALRNADFACYWRAHPLHAVTIDKNVFASGGAGALTPFPTDHFADGDAYMQEDRYRFRRNESEQQDFENCLKVAHKLPIEESKDPFQRRNVPGTEPPPSEAPNPNAKHSPLEHYVVLGVNQKLQPGPIPLSHDQLPSIMDWSRDVVNAIFGFPKGSAFGKAGKDQASAESLQEHRIWDGRVQGWIEKITSFFNEIYLAVYYDEHREYVNGVFKYIRSESKEFVRKGLAVDTTDIPDDEITQLMNEDEKRKLSEALKAKKEQNKSNLKKLISDNVIPEFNIGYVPNITLGDLQALLNSLVINEDTYVEYAAMLYHIPPEKVMSKEDREKQRKDMEEQALHQTEESLRLQAKYTPEKSPSKPNTPNSAVRPVDISPSSMLHKGTKPSAKNSGKGESK